MCHHRCLLTLALVFGCGCSKTPPPADHPPNMVNSDKPYVGVVDVDMGRFPQGDKTILRIDNVDPDDAFLGNLYDYAARFFPDGTWASFGPDSEYRQIVFFSRGRKIELQSWHPLFEENPKLVVGSYGVTALEGQTRDEALRQDDQEYVRRRNAFDEIERRLREHYGN